MKLFLRRHSVEIAVTLILCLLLFLFMVANPRTFLSGRIYSAYMATIPFAGIMAIAMTFVVTAGEMDLSFPAVLAAAGLVFAQVFLWTGSPVFGTVTALAMGAIAGGINGIIVVRVGVPAIIATIGTQFFWRGLTVLAAGGLARSLVEIRSTGFHSLTVGRAMDTIPSQFLWFCGIALFAGLLYSRHVFGDNIRFVGDNKEAAATMGIPVDRVRIGVFLLMGMAAALSGVLVTTEMASWWPTLGEGFMLIVFAAVFIGGTSVFGGEGSVYGTLVGAVIIGIIEAGIIAAGLSGLWTRMVHGLVILSAVSLFAVLQKQGAGRTP